MFAEVLTRARVRAGEHRREVGVSHLAAQSERLRAEAGPASWGLAAGGVVLELLLCDRVAQVPHRLLDTGELTDRDHRGNPSCMSFSVGRKRLQSAYFFGTFDLEEISDATVCGLGWSMHVREVVKAGQEVRCRCVCRRWREGGRLVED